MVVLICTWTTAASVGASPSKVTDGGAPAGAEDIATADSASASTNINEVSLGVTSPSCEASKRR